MSKTKTFTYLVKLYHYDGSVSTTKVEARSSWAAVKQAQRLPGVSRVEWLGVY